MNIVYVVHQFFPKYHFGTETYTLQLALEMKGMGHDVSVIAGDAHEEFRGINKDHPEFYREIPVYQLGTRPFAERVFRSSYDRPEFEIAFRDILVQLRPDIVHFTHTAYLGANLIAVAKSLGCRVVVSFTDFFGICWAGNMMRADGAVCNGPAPGMGNCLGDYYFKHPVVMESKIGSFLARNAMGNRGRIFSKAIKLCYPVIIGEHIRSEMDSILSKCDVSRRWYSFADAFVTATAFLRETYVSNGFSSQKMHLQSFGVRMPSLEERRRLDARYTRFRNDDKQAVRFGFIGQIAKHKGIDILVEEFMRLGDTRAELWIYGKLEKGSPSSRSLENAAGLNPGIKLCGSFDSESIYDVIAGLDVLCIPSRWHENAPLVLMNGLASKTCMIVSDGKGLTEFVDGRNGFVFPSDRPEKLGDILHQIVADSKVLERIHSTHPGYAISTAAYAEKIEAVYESVSAPTDAQSRRDAAGAIFRKLPDSWRDRGDFLWPPSAISAFRLWNTANHSFVKNPLGGSSGIFPPVPPDSLRLDARGNLQQGAKVVLDGFSVVEALSELAGTNILHSPSTLVIDSDDVRVVRAFHGTSGVTYAGSSEEACRWVTDNVSGVSAVRWETLSSIPVPDGLFSVVVCAKLPHRTDPATLGSLLGECSRVLYDDGRISAVFMGLKGFLRMTLFRRKLYHYEGLRWFSTAGSILPLLIRGCHNFLGNDELNAKEGREVSSHGDRPGNLLVASLEGVKRLAKSNGLYVSNVSVCGYHGIFDIVELVKTPARSKPETGGFYLA